MRRESLRESRKAKMAVAWAKVVRKNQIQPICKLISSLWEFTPVQISKSLTSKDAEVDYLRVNFF